MDKLRLSPSRVVVGRDIVLEREIPNVMITLYVYHQPKSKMLGSFLGNSMIYLKRDTNWFYLIYTKVNQICDISFLQIISKSLFSFRFFQA